MGWRASGSDGADDDMSTKPILALVSGANRGIGLAIATGLAEDVRRYGAWMRDQAKQRIGDLYPDATVIDEKTKKQTPSAMRPA